MKGFSIFLTIVIIVYLILNTAAWLWIRNMFHLSGRGLAVSRILFIAVALLFPIGRILKYKSVNPLSLGAQATGEIWLGFLFWMFFIAGATLTVRLAINLGRWESAKQWLGAHSPYLGTVVLVVVLAGLTYGYIHARNPVVRRLNIELNRPEYPPFQYTIVQLSDLHIDSIRSVSWWEKVVERVNALNPDIIVMTGDILENKSRNLQPFKPGFQRLTAKLGVYATTGNHEFYVGTGEFENYFRDTHIRVLRNTVIRPDDFLGIIALDDPTGHRSFDLPEPDLQKLADSLPDDRPKILLHHEPRRIAEALSSGIDLKLSGHTHCGQMWPFGYFVKMAYDYPCGYYQIDNLHLYVIPGTGFWGPPFRVGTHSVIAAINFSNRSR